MLLIYCSIYVCITMNSSLAVGDEMVKIFYLNGFGSVCRVTSQFHYSLDFL